MVKNLPPASRQEPVLRQRIPRRRLLSGTILLYGILLSLISWMQVIGPERFWWSAVNMYLPQWIWALPGAVLLVGAVYRLVRKRKRPDRYYAAVLAIALAGIIWVAGPIMGFCGRLPWRNLQPQGTRIRIMTYNIKWGHRDLSAVMKQIADAQPDLLLLQDVGETLDGALGGLFRGWTVYHYGQYVIASRLPLSSPRLGSLAFSGEGNGFLCCQLHAGQTVIEIYDVHLLTPRSGLAAVRSLSGISEFNQETAARLQQAADLVQDLRRERNPVIVAGDFNAPLESLVCQRIARRNLQDAFASGGWGYGYTYGHSLKFGQSFVRIDHIFASPSLHVTNCRAGDKSGSDHRPVIADLALPN